MKTLHLTIIATLIFVFSCTLYMENSHDAYATCFTINGTQECAPPPPILNTNKSHYVPNDIIQIVGVFHHNATIQIDLVDPNNSLKNSILLQSDDSGSFQGKLVVPNDAVNGTWKINTSSGINHSTLNIIVISKNLPENQTTKTTTLILDPLHQFKSGIASMDVQCRQGLWLIFKTSDDSPTCVKPDTAYMLIHRGWANTISQTSLNTMSTDASSSCDTPYPKSKVGIAVLYMQPNSTGKICATYHNPDSPAQSNIEIFTAKDVQQQASEIVTSAYPDVAPTGNSTIVYTIKTGNQAGLYGISFFCDAVPFAVGYDNQSRIILDDFPWLYKSDICLSQTNVFQIIGLSGIHVKYVTMAHRD